MFNSRIKRPFKNRKDAGEQLGKFLVQKYKNTNPLVIGIPRGGVEVGDCVARILEAELAIIVSRKLSFPGNTELGFGAVTEEAEVYVSAIGRDTLPSGIIDRIIAQQLQEAERRVKIYRKGRPLPEMSERTVILVDDGIAMGVTLVPVLRLCRKKGAAKVIIASPVSGTNYDRHLDEADGMEILVQPENFHGVGQVYDQFGDFPDEAVVALLK